TSSAATTACSLPGGRAGTPASDSASKQTRSTAATTSRSATRSSWPRGSTGTSADDRSALNRGSSSGEEVPLLGGMSTPGVVRVGDTVRRPQNANSDYVHELLLHLERCGFDGAPRYLGVDDRGREILTFIEGFAPPHNGFRLTEEAVRAGARLVRGV